MKKIVIPVITENGKLRAVFALKQIQEFTKEITFPNMDLNKVSLSMLTLTNDDTKKCVNGYFVGNTWNNEKKYWENGEMILYFM